MKTAYRTAYGPPAVLSVREVSVPEPRAGEVLLRVRSATVNRTDCGALWGRPYIFRFFVGWPRPRQVATGTDVAGEVVARGAGVSRFAVGDRVMGFGDNGLGSHAQFVAVSERCALARVPTGVSFTSAAASMEGAHYARNFMNKVPVRAGDDVLVYGATGAIGSAAVALLAHAGMKVTAVCAGEHHAAVASMGARRLLDHTRGDWVAELDGQRFPFVFDAVGKLTLAACRPVMLDTGVYISSELGPWGQNLVYALLAPLMRGPTVRFPLPLDIPQSLALVTPLLERGEFVPLIDRSYPLEQVREAFEYVASGRKIGNVLLTFD